ncbi:MAG: MarR family transcriptional regulator [Anaeroplasmataceae bacterium]|nr:MarR family transcriptional regulator [Anaeroplasmataceae bacterium]
MKQEEILKTIELLKSASQFIGNARASLCTPYGLTPLQAIILIDIYHHPNQTRITDICKRLNKTTNTISPLVNRMIDKNYLIKRQNSKDNRIFEVFFSNRGEEIMTRMNQDILNFANPYFAKLSEEEFKNLYQSLILLNKVCDLL